MFQWTFLLGCGGGAGGRVFILSYIWALEMYVCTCAHTLTLSQYIPPKYPNKIYKFFREYSDTYIDIGGGYCKYFLTLRWSKPACYSFSLNGLWLDGMWEHWSGVEFYWCSVLFSSQQFSALTEVLFHFLTEPKEVKYFVIRGVSGCGSTVLRCLASDSLICAVPFLQVERFLAQLSEFATINQISVGPLRSIVKSFLLVPNGE